MQIKKILKMRKKLKSYIKER